MVVKIEIVSFGSDLYKKSIDLRYEILRKPLGLFYTEEQLIEEHDQFHFVAIIDNEIVGVIVMQLLPFNIAKMRQVAIMEKLQGFGIGKQMVLFVEEWCKSKEIKKVILHARSNAVLFYQKLNYNICSNLFVEVGINHYEMEKQLN